MSHQPRLEDLIDADTLWGWNEYMASLNFRHTGSTNHLEFISWIEREVKSLGLEVTRYPTPLNYWEAEAWSLSITDASGASQEIPVAFYWPYSGETPSEGIAAQLVDVGGGGEEDYSQTDVRGKIALVDFPVAAGKADVLLELSPCYHPGFDDRGRSLDLSEEDLSRVPIPGPPNLELAAKAGALGAISILDMHPDNARGQFYPHQQMHAGIPALHVDREQGVRLRNLLALGSVTAEVKLVARRESRTVDFLVAELPGNGTLSGAILVNTNTDGQNAIEENGALAMMGMADHFSRLDQSSRPRDLLFLFSPTHMISNEDSIHADVWLKQHPDFTHRVVAALTPEHLGAMQWEEDRRAGTYAATGKSELAIVAVGNSDTLTQLAIGQVVADGMDRTIVLGPNTRGNLYGEGTRPYWLGIPTITYITVPTYLLSVDEVNGHLDKLDRDRLHRETLFLTRLLSRMINFPDDFL